MSKIQDIENFLINLVLPQNYDLMKQAQRELLHLYATDPNKIISIYLQYLDDIYFENSQKYQAQEPRNKMIETIKQFIFLQINFCISGKNHSYKDIWRQLTAQVKQDFKIRLFAYLVEEPIILLKRQISRAIGTLGSVVVTTNQSWPEYKENIMQLFLHSDERSVICAFHILESIYDTNSIRLKNIVPEILNLFQTGFRYKNFDIKISTLHCFSSYLNVLDVAQYSRFQHLILAILEFIHIGIKEKRLENLICFASTTHLCPRFFAPYTDLIFQKYLQIHDIPDLQEQENDTLMQILIDFCQEFPEAYSGKKENINILYTIIFGMIYQIPQRIQQHLLIVDEKQALQHFQNHPAFEQLNTYLEYIEILIKNDKRYSKNIKTLQTVYYDLIRNPQDEFAFLGLIVLSRIGEHLLQRQANIEQKQQIFVFIDANLNSNVIFNVFAAIQASCLVSSCLSRQQPEFIHDKLINQIIRIIQNNPHQRLVSQALFNLALILQDQDFDISLTKFNLQQIVQITLSKIGSNTKPLVKESAYYLLTALAQKFQDMMAPFLNPIFQLVMYLNHDSHWNVSCYSQLRAQSLETLAHVAVAVGTQRFNRYIQPFIEVLSGNRQRQGHTYAKPPVKYVLIAWQKLLELYQGDLQLYIQKEIHNLMAEVLRIVQEQVKRQQQDEFNQNATTFDSQLLMTAFQLLNMFIKNTNVVQLMYADHLFQMYNFALSNVNNVKVLQQVFHGLPITISCFKDQKAKRANAKHFIMVLFGKQKQCQNFTLDSMIILFQSMIDIFKNIDVSEESFLTQLDIDYIQNSLSNNHHFVHGQIIKIGNQMKNSPKEQKQDLAELIQLYNKLEVKLIGVLEQTFRLHSYQSLVYVLDLVCMVLPNLLRSPHENHIKMAIFILDDILEHISYDLIANIAQHIKNIKPQYYEANIVQKNRPHLHLWSQIQKMLLQNLIHSTLAIRQGAAYGIGLLANKTPVQRVPHVRLVVWLSAIYNSIRIQKGPKQKTTKYLQCRDNLVAALGKVIKNHFKNICSSQQNQPYIQLWIQNLPLLHDLSETFEQCMILNRLVMQQRPNFNFLTNRKLMVRVLEVFTAYLTNKKLMKWAMFNNLSKIFEFIKHQQDYIDNQDEILKEVSPRTRQILLIPQGNN